MRKGSYILLVELEEDFRIEIGGDEKLLKKGFYTYFGSAFGPGGLKRIKRHREVSKGEREVRHWHIDYLTGLEVSEIIESVKFPQQDIECELASEAENYVENFGSTDCSCGSHLSYFNSRQEAEAFLDRMEEKF
ncbi:MAG: DUF123 domain-containing protein [Candidatus Nanohalobium sp.]